MNPPVPPGPEPDPDPPEPEPATNMVIHLTNAMNQSFYFGIRWYVNGTPQDTDSVFLNYNESHRFSIPSEGQTTVRVYASTTSDAFSGSILSWNAGDYTGSTPPFVEGQEVNANYAGNNASTRWDVVE